MRQTPALAYELLWKGESQGAIEAHLGRLCFPAASSDVEPPALMLGLQVELSSRAPPTWHASRLAGRARGRTASELKWDLIAPRLEDPWELALRLA